MRAYHSELKRGADTINATVWIETKGADAKPRKVKFEVSYTCLPYLVRDLREIWHKERDARMQQIAKIDAEF